MQAILPTVCETLPLAEENTANRRRTRDIIIESL